MTEHVHQAITWNPIPSQPDYEAGSDGSIRSLKRGTPRLRAAFPNRDGYLFLELSQDGCGTQHFVHMLVAEAFYGPKPEGMQVRHLDGNPANNALGNLRYGSVSENVLDQVRHGTHANAAKTRCRNGHEFDGANTYRHGNDRICRTCNAAAAARYKARKQAAA